jgi:hypothetical protein
MSPIETIKLDGGYTLKVFHDEDAEAPQEKDSEPDVFLACPSNRYFEPVIPKRAGSSFEAIDRDEYEEFPLYAYIHSGVWLYMDTNESPCAWDSGRIGSVFVKRDDESPNKRADVAADWVKYWNSYLSGERYGYQLEGPDGDRIDSCLGFDDLEYMKGEVMDIHRSHLEEDSKTEKMLTL